MQGSEFSGQCDHGEQQESFQHPGTEEATKGEEAHADFSRKRALFAAEGRVNVGDETVPTRGPLDEQDQIKV